MALIEVSLPQPYIKSWKFGEAGVGQFTTLGKYRTLHERLAQTLEQNGRVECESHCRELGRCLRGYKETP